MQIFKIIAFFCIYRRAALLAKLQAGTTLIVDRYAYSGVAFTAAKALPGLDAVWCKAPDAGLPAPDATFFLHLTPEAAAARGGYGEERYEKAAFQKAVIQQFELLREPEWRWVDADKSIEGLQEELRKEVMEVVEGCRAGKVMMKKLWDGEELVLPSSNAS